MFSKENTIASAILAILSSAIASSVSSVDSSCPMTFITATPTITSSIILSASSSTSTSLQSSLQGASSSVLTSASSSSTNANPTSTLPPNDCHEDNCRRQFIKAPEIRAFCKSHTTTINTITTGLPITYPCVTPIRRVSPRPAPPSPPQLKHTNSYTDGLPENNFLRQYMNLINTQVTPFCYAYTTTVDTALAALPDFVSMCGGEPSKTASACSCVPTRPLSLLHSSSPMQLAPTPSSSTLTLSFISSSSSSSPASTTSSGISANTSVLSLMSSGDSASTADGVLTSLSSTSSRASASFCPFVLETHATTTTSTHIFS